MPHRVPKGSAPFFLLHLSIGKNNNTVSDPGGHECHAGHHSPHPCALRPATGPPAYISSWRSSFCPFVPLYDQAPLRCTCTDPDEVDSSSVRSNGGGAGTAVEGEEGMNPGRAVAPPRLGGDTKAQERQEHGGNEEPQYTGQIKRTIFSKTLDSRRFFRLRCLDDAVALQHSAQSSCSVPEVDSTL